MSFKDAIRKLSEKTKELVDTASKNYKYNKKLEETKFEILMKFKMDDLKRICRSKGISTKKLTDFFEGTYAEITRKDELVEKMLDLPLETIISYAKRYGIDYRSELEELKEFERELFGEEEKAQEKEGYLPREKLVEEISESSKKVAVDVVSKQENEQEELIKAIRDDFKPEMVRNEEDFEKQLYQFLLGKFSSRKIERQVVVGGNTRIDIVIDNKYGIELKIADSAQKLHTLIGQAIIYKKELKEVIAVILDCGANINVDNFIKTLEELKVHVIRLHGNVRRIGKKGEVVIKLRR